MNQVEFHIPIGRGTSLWQKEVSLRFKKRWFLPSWSVKLLVWYDPATGKFGVKVLGVGF